MTKPLMLIGGAALWICAAGLQLGSGGYSDLSHLIASAGFLLMAYGVLTLWPPMPGGLLGRVGLVLCALGMVMVAATVTSLMGSGVRSDAEIATRADYLAYSGVIVVGVICSALWIMLSGAYPVAIGLTLLFATAVTVAVPFLAVPAGVQSVANIVLAAMLIVLAVYRLRAIRGAARAPR